jgi:hypothetical protein
MAVRHLTTRYGFRIQNRFKTLRATLTSKVLRSIPRLVFAILIASAMLIAVLPSAREVVGSPGLAQSSISAYLNCPSGLSYAFPGGSGSCPSGVYSAVYTGVSQTVATTQFSVFYLASASGGVKVTFNFTDTTTGKPLFNGVAYGSISGGTCSSPSVVVPASFTATSNLITSGDTLKLSLNTTFTGTGTPMFCSGGASATLVGAWSTPSGSNQYLTTALSAGTPSQTTLSGYQGVSIAYSSNSGNSVTAVVLGILKAGTGSTVDILASSVTVPAGQSATAFLVMGQYPSGTYTITIVAFTGSDVPVSTSASVTVIV